MSDILTIILHAVWYIGNLTFCIKLALDCFKADKRWRFAYYLSMSATWFVFMVRYLLFY